MSMPDTPGLPGRPSGKTGRTQLQHDDLVRIKTLYNDARMGPTEIQKVTGYTINQVKYALKKKTATVGKRSGRPRKGDSSKNKKGGKGEGAEEGLGGGVEELEGDVDVDMEEDETQVEQPEEQPTEPARHPLPSEPDHRLAEVQAAIEKEQSV